MRRRPDPVLGRPPLPRRDAALRGLLLLVALVLAAAPLSQLLAGSAWLTLVLTAAVPVLGAGILLRLTLRHPGLVALLQVLVIAALVLGLEVRAGLVSPAEGPAAVLRTQADILPAAVTELTAGVAPVAVGLRAGVLVVLVLALLALALDLLFVEMGWHTPTGFALLGFLLVPSLQYPGGGPGWTVVGPVLAAVLVFGTRTVHPDPRTLRGSTRPQHGATAGGTVLALGLCGLLVALATAPLAGRLPHTAPPRVSLSVDQVNQWRDGGTARLGGVMVSDDVSVRRSLLEQDPAEVLRYTTTAPTASYLRLRTLTEYRDSAYRTGPEDDVGDLASYSDARTDGALLDPDSEGLETYEVEITSLAGSRLPVPADIRRLDLTDPEGRDGRPVGSRLEVLPTNGEVTTGRSVVSLAGVGYRVGVEPNPATADELRAVSAEDLALPVTTGYLDPRQVPQVARDLATEVARDAEATTAFDTAVAFQEHFRSGYGYSLRVSTPPGEDPLESFLADRVGYCEQFAATFALMMTSLGYPTRVAVGFTPGSVDGDERVVQTTNAHAWPEVWFGPEHGWVRFEPTPAAAGNGVSEPPVTTAPGEEVEAPTLAPTPEDEEPTSPTPEDPSSQEAATTAASATPEGTTSPGAADTAGPSVGDRLLRGAGVVLGLGALAGAAAVAGVAGPRALRDRRRSARWAALRDGPPGPGAGERAHRAAALLALEDLGLELRGRRREIAVLGWTGRWGRPPVRPALDAALPPTEALAGLLDDVAGGRTAVEDTHRAAAGRLGAAVTTALYAPPLRDAPDTPDPDAPDPAPAVDPGPVLDEVRADADLLIGLVRRAR